MPRSCISRIGYGTAALVVPPSLGVKTVTELIELAKARPNELIFSHAGIGSSTHMNSERFRLAAGMKVKQVGFKGGADAIIEVIAGRVHFAIVGLTSTLPHIKDRRLVALAVNTPQRSSVLPDVPALAERVDGFDGSGWQGLFVPAGTPAEVVRMAAEVCAAHGRPVATPAEARRITMLRAGPARVSLLSYAYGFNGYPAPNGESWRSNPIDVARIERDGVELDFTPPFRRVSFVEGIRERTGLDIRTAGDDPMRAALQRKGLPAEEIQSYSGGKLQDEVFKQFLEPDLIQPTFVIDYPKALSPLARLHRDDPTLTERFELFVNGKEIANAFSELNDPDEQRRRFEQQRAELARGDTEAQPFDEAFVEALEHGMPPTGGVGLGIDRLVMILCGAATVREVLLFPAMRT